MTQSQIHDVVVYNPLHDQNDDPILTETETSVEMQVAHLCQAIAQRFAFVSIKQIITTQSPCLRKLNRLLQSKACGYYLPNLQDNVPCG